MSRTTILGLLVYGGGIAVVAACSAPAPVGDLTPQPVPTPTPTVTTPPPVFDGGAITPLPDSGVVTPGACTPAAVTPTTPAWVTPRYPLLQPLCPNTQEGKTMVHNIVTCFLNGPTDPTCTAQFPAIPPQCLSCAVSTTGAVPASALIKDAAGAALELNVEGCVAGILGDPSANGCGPKLAAKYACEAAACASCVDDASAQTCTTSADTSVCSTQVAGAACAQQVPAGNTQTALALCIPPTATTQYDVAYNLVRLFCVAAN